MARKTLKVDPKSDLHKKLITRLTSFKTLASQGQETMHENWRKAEERVMAYIPESAADSIRRTDREVSGTPKYTTIMVPYTYAVLMSAHTYWTSVFFSRDPVHQFAGLHGETENQVLAMEALIAYQVEVGEMLAPYYIWLYDSGKYGVGWLGEYWCQETLAYGELVEMDIGDGKGPQVFQTTQELAGYMGNRVYNVSPYDFWPDPRVPVGRFQSGEFCIARKRMGWSAIQDRGLAGYFMNLDKLHEHKGPDRGATDGSSRLNRPDFMKTELNWDINEKGDQVKHPSGMTFFEFYIELIPSEWGLGDSMRHQKWCITITEDLGLIVGCSPLNYYHCKFPFDVLETEIEGYGLYNRGMPEVLEPIQNTMDWLLNTHFFNTRAALNNQFIVDPSKLVIKDVANSGKPGFMWRLRPEAYGSDISKMFMQVPVHDVTGQHMQDLQGMFSLGEKTLGVNEQIMGALAGTGRKTATEIRTSTGFGVNRMKSITEYMSATGFSRHARRLTQNSQQMYDVQGKLRIVGDAAIAAGQKFLTVGPEDIAGYFLPLPVDGTLPIDRQAQANLWKEIMMGITRMPPQIMQSYDFSKIFAWAAQLGGLKNINQMRVQVMPPGMAPPNGAIPIGGPGAVPQLPAPQGTPGIGSPDANTTYGMNSLQPSPAGGQSGY